VVFSSVLFVLVFLPFVLLLHTGLYVVTRNKPAYRTLNVIILLASLVFYGWGEPQYILLLLFSTVFNHRIALLLDSAKTILRCRMFLAVGISGNLLLLLYFKYAGLFYEVLQLTNLHKALSQLVDMQSLTGVALPIGISFYTYQGISYIVDVYRKEVKVSKSLIDFACYLTMFSQLIAGPIVRYIDIRTALQVRYIDSQYLASGTTRFIYGLAKKILIADTLGQVADAAFAVPDGQLSSAAAWLGLVCYTLQIYFDFSGYSDMAIGMGRMMGFSFPENFNYPYISQSIREFWQRWHISLSTWFRDYLYIPLGGNRRGTVHTLCNLFLVFALCGLWHGATLGFVIWGIYHGSFLVFERIFPRFTERLPRVLRHMYTMFAVMMGWVVFRTEHFSPAVAYYKSLLGFTTPLSATAANEIWFRTNGWVFPIALAAAVFLSTPIYTKLSEALQHWHHQQGRLLSVMFLLMRDCWVLSLLLLSMLPLFGATYNAFIYFRF